VWPLRVSLLSRGGEAAGDAVGVGDGFGG